MPTDCTDRTRETLKKYIEENMPEKRKAHVYGVVNTARALAEKYGVNAEKAETAALCHDLYRALPASELNRRVKELGLENKYIDNPNLAHGKVAAGLIEKEFGIEDTDIINAVSFHTTGRADMSLLEKIIYIADAVEPGRDYPGVEELRKELEKGLDEACLASLEHTAEHVRAQGRELDGDTLAAAEYLRREKEQKEKSND